MKCHFCEKEATTRLSVTGDCDFALCDAHLARLRFLLGNTAAVTVEYQVPAPNWNVIGQQCEHEFAMDSTAPYCRKCGAAWTPPGSDWVEVSPGTYKFVGKRLTLSEVLSKL